MAKIIRKVTCLRCGKSWYPHRPGRPHACANRRCRSTTWDEPRPSRQLPTTEDDGKILAAVGGGGHGLP